MALVLFHRKLYIITIRKKCIVLFLLFGENREIWRIILRNIELFLQNGVKLVLRFLLGEIFFVGTGECQLYIELALLLSF